MRRRHQSGLGAVAAVVVLVLLAILAASIVRLSTASHAAMAQETQGARALAGARAGIDWGLFQVLRGGWVGCSGATTQTLDLRADNGVWVTVTCTGNAYNEGESTPGVARVQRVYTLTSVACNGASGACPDNTAAQGPRYVERMRVVTVME